LTISGAIMKNITITLDEKTAVWARVHAAKHNKSVSRLVGEMLQKHMHESREYDEAMRRYLAIKPYKFEKPGGRLPTREELHDRASLRRR
jgi:plasmid stability protein